ncbi:hypothetical protein OH76DRAFT_1416096 [Lentinus brumalis]|uniref:Uncharacterized protein n=1 Tax=Lentinus brumalis TaxID=2498619 RepID=A0A371DLN7_9APHY|nr:hypothetical protein OH76DRAFT_1416096 [Polyporus brumalis]
MAIPERYVLAKWTGYVEGMPKNRTEFLARTHAYQVVRRPLEPLELGTKVKVYAVTPKNFCSPEAPDGLLEAYDAHILGQITRVVGWRGSSVGLEVRNECWKSAVRKIRLEVVYIPDVTVRRLVHLRPGKGPTVARDDELSSAADVVLPPAMWSCGAGGCRMREPGTLGDGVLYVYWPTAPEDRVGTETSARGPRKKRKRGNLDAVGWERDGA